MRSFLRPRWASIASAYNSLASTTIVDIYKRRINATADDAHYLRVSRWATIGWGLFCIVVAQFANRLGSLIEAVNVLGSLFYGVILGIFLVAFYLPRHWWPRYLFCGYPGRSAGRDQLLARPDRFLWLNVIGCLLVIGFAWVLEQIMPKPSVV